MKIKIKIFPDDESRLRQRIEAAARQGAEAVRVWFDFSVDELEIEVYGSRQQWIEEHTRLNQEELATWVAGDSGRIIRVVATGSEAHLLRMVAHECVHHILHRHVASLPAWLDEGIAMHLLFTMPQHYRQELEQAVRHNALLPFDLLAKSFAVLGRGLKDLAYAQSWAMVEHIGNRYGSRMLKELLLALGRGESLDMALRPWGTNMYLLEGEMCRCYSGQCSMSNEQFAHG